MHGTSKDLADESPSAERAGNLGIIFSNGLPTMKEAKNILIEEALKRAKGNKTLAAQTLGMTRQAISKRSKEQIG